MNGSEGLGVMTAQRRLIYLHMTIAEGSCGFGGWAEINRSEALCYAVTGMTYSDSKLRWFGVRAIRDPRESA